MFRRIIASMLVFALLGYGTGWAFSGHAVDLGDHALGIAHVDPQEPIGEGGCDHCCHATAHMTGMPSPILSFRHAEPECFRHAAGRTAARLASAPPLKPPRS